MSERGTPVGSETCHKHESVVVELNLHRQEIKAMKENISEIKADNAIQNKKLDKIHETLSSLAWKIIGSIGAMVFISQLILNFVK